MTPRTLTLLSMLLAVPLLAAPSGRAAPRYEDALIPGVPHVKQRPDFCGEACAEMYLKKLGVAVDQDGVFNRAGIDPLLGRGLVTSELATALGSLGFQVGPVWHSIAARRAAEDVEEEWKALHADLLRGVPSIVCMHYSDAPRTTEHFRLILGYSSSSDEVLYNEPAEADGAYRHMDRALFLKLWKFHPAPDRVTLIRMALERRPQERNALEVPPSSGPSDADYAQHVMALKEKLPRGTTMVIERPFVVLGDELPEKVRARARNTVRWTRDLLRKDFFARDPDEITDVWMFKDAASYQRNSLALFNERPTTPYGYYLHGQRAMVMNIAPGDGTLVHELVHPYMSANVPGCPAWLNEGLASLYERPSEKGGHIIGRPNWRLPALQRAIARREAPELKQLTALDPTAFYDDDTGLHYAAARYVCHYLQEKGLLVTFFARYLEQREKDPTGYRTLLDVLAETDGAAFQRRWEESVAKLRVP